MSCRSFLCNLRSLSVTTQWFRRPQNRGLCTAVHHLGTYSCWTGFYESSGLLVPNRKTSVEFIHKFRYLYQKNSVNPLVCFCKTILLQKRFPTPTKHRYALGSNQYTFATVKKSSIAIHYMCSRLHSSNRVALFCTHSSCSRSQGPALVWVIRTTSCDT